MVEAPTQVTLYFDYRCPFCNRLTRVLMEAEQRRPDLQVNWRYFSLEQLNAPIDGWKIWEQPVEYDLVEQGPFAMRMLRAFLASYAASLQGEAAFRRFHLLLFFAKHDEKKVMSDSQVILDVARRADLDMKAFEQAWQSQAGRDRLQSDHTSGQNLGIRGVPSLIIDNMEPLYVRLADHPPAAERLPLFDDLLRLVTRRPYLRTFRYVHNG